MEKKTTGASLPLELVDRSHPHPAGTAIGIQVVAEEMDLVVVGGHHHEVIRCERVPRSVLVDPGGSDQPADLGRHDLRLFLGLGGAISMVGLEPPQAGTELGALSAQLGWLTRRPS